ncbi:hypothetical protein EW146_g4965 [Bondarzewia mesenterica]|uniref:Uncharacterized protein n=1 Tax=Bondarzewia mesenterica TaxID=1095465 RepID=A0A4S4LYN2_9AGAM|nr:hypothetical protein EW146_g4965 [Bondarzewia mesenterica]
MPLSYKGYRAHISCSGHRLKEYEINTVSNVVNCIIASQRGQEFRIHVESPGTYAFFDVFLDGSHVLTGRLEPDFNGWWGGKTTQNGRLKPFKFVEVETTEIEAEASDPTPDLLGTIFIDVFPQEHGEIEVSMDSDSEDSDYCESSRSRVSPHMGTWDLRQRVKREGDVAAASGTAKQDADNEVRGGCFRVDRMDENKPRLITEKCKHAGCDRIMLGQARRINDETASRNSKNESTLEGEPFVTFTFSYWPTAHLQAKGVIPTPQPLLLKLADNAEISAPVTTIKGKNGEEIRINANSDITARFKTLQEKRLALQAEEDAIMLDTRQELGASIVKRDASPIRLQGSLLGTLIDLTLDADDS